MFNLLPENLKQKIKSEYKIRLLIAILIFVVFLEFTFLALLAPSWLSSYYRKKEMLVNEDAKIVAQLASSTSSIISTIQLTNNRLRTLDNSFQYPSVAPALNVILSKKTNSIHINQLSFTLNNDKNKTASIALSGISATREALVSFSKNLQNSGVFKSVDLPVSSLTKDSNLEFSINIIL